MPASLDQPQTTDAGSTLSGSAFQLALPAIFVAVLLLLGTAFEGAFEIRYWAPPALFVLIMLASLAAAGGGAPVRSRGLIVALIGVWGLATLGVLSALWADAPANALETGLRTVLYAAVFTVPVVVLRHQRSLRLTASILAAGIGVIALVTLGRLLVADPDVVVAGRLDGPVGYRNASALLFCLGFWPLVTIAAKHGASRLLRSFAFGLAELELCLAFLTQSRGVLIGFAAGGLIVVSLGPDRVRRAWLAILALGLLAACSGGLLTTYSAFDGGQGVPTDGDITRSGVWLVVATALATLAGALFSVFDSGLRTAVTTRKIARWSLGAIVVVGAVGAIAAVGNPVDQAREQWDEFRGLETIADGSTRYFNAGGQRYDLWRVAVKEFEDHPLHGAGAGNYASRYYEERKNDRNLDDPHSLPFQLGAELGLLGLGALALFLAGVVVMVSRGWRRLHPDDQRLSAGMLATGAVLMGQSLVDWMWRIPGVAAIGIFAIGVGVAVVARGTVPGVRERWMPIPSRIAIAAAAIVLAGFTFTTFLSDYYVRDARAERGKDAVAQLDSARRARSLSGSSLPPMYLEASALESLGQVERARRVLLEARRKVPRDFTTLALIGDLEARAGRFAEAKVWYGRALALNPADVGLQQLAKSGGRPG